MRQKLTIKRCKSALLLLVLWYSAIGGVYAQSMGVNYNGVTANIDLPDLDRTNTTWVRFFIDYFDYKNGTLNINTNEGLAKLEAAKAAGYKVILSLKFDFSDRNFPTGTIAIDADLNYVSTILDRLYDDADIIVAGNEPFIESLQKGNNLVNYYKRAAISVLNYRSGQIRKVPIYIGAFNRLWEPAEQTQAVVDYLTFARENTWIEGADLHIHHDDINQITTALNFVNGSIRSNQKMLVTEFSLMKHWKNNLNQTIPSILSTEYGRPADWKVYQYLDYTLNTAPVTRNEWVAFLQNSPWFENRKNYLANAWARFTSFPKFNVATYGMYQTYGSATFTASTDPWILNPLFVNRTVVKNSMDQNQFNYSFIDDFRQIQISTSALTTNSMAINEESKLTFNTDPLVINETLRLKIYPNPAGRYLKVEGATGKFVIFAVSSSGYPIKTFAGSQVDITDLKPGSYILRHEQSGKAGIFLKE